MMLVSRAPVEKLQAYKQRMGWSLDWASTVGSDFNRNGLHCTPGGAEARSSRARLPPAVVQNAEACGTDVADVRRGGAGPERVHPLGRTVYRTYVSTARGLEPAMAYYGLLDRAAMGRQEEGEQAFWLHRRDEYATG